VTDAVEQQSLINRIKRCIFLYFCYTCIVARFSADDAILLEFLETVKMMRAIITALHGMQSRYSDGNSVCLSVCPSVRPSVRLSNACIVTKRKKNLSRFLYHAKDHSV